MLQIKNIIVSSKEPSVTDGILWINPSGESKKLLYFGANGWEEISGKNEGFVILDENGKVPSYQLPSYVDDVVEYGSKDSFPTDGEKGKIYVDTATNSTYRWSGTLYINVSNPANFGRVSDIVCNSPSFKQEGGDLTYEYDSLDKNTGEVEHFSSLVPTSTSSNNGLMSKEDKTLLTKTNEYGFLAPWLPANPEDFPMRPYPIYSNPDADGITIYFPIIKNGSNGYHAFKLEIPLAGAYRNGWMSSRDKVKLDSLGTIPVYNSIEEVPSDITSKCIVTVGDIPYMMEKCSMMTDKDTAPVSTYKLEATAYVDSGGQGTGATYYTSYMRYIDGQWTEVYNDVAYDYATNLNFIYEQATGAVKKLTGKPNGIASLDSNGIIPSSQLPSYVDDVIEVYATYNKDNAGNLSNIQIYTDVAHTNSITGESGKVYINIAENEPNYQFRWTGSEFVQISGGGLVIGEVEGTAFDGKKGKELNDYVNIAKHHGIVLNGEGLDYQFGYFQKANGQLVNTVPILNANGTISHKDVPLPVATQEKNGIMTGKDKLKLNSLYNINSINILEANNATSRQYTINLKKSIYDVGVVSSISENLTIPSATSATAGLMSATDKTLFDKLGIDPDGLAVYTLYIIFGQGFAMSDTFAFNAAADELSFNWRGFKSGSNYVPGSTEQCINNDTGKRVLPLATATTAGVMSASDKTKLDNIDNNVLYSTITYDKDGTTTTLGCDFAYHSTNLNLVIPTRNTNTGEVSHYIRTLPAVTQKHNGLLSNIDKIKLDTLESIPTYTSASDIPVDVTAKQIKLTIGGEECLFTRAKNGTYIAYAGGVNSQAGHTEKLNFIVLTPHLDAGNNIDSWVTTSHVSIDEAKYESLYTKITSLEETVASLNAQINPNGGSIE